MGAKLAELYEKASKLGGLKAKMRMAVLTGVASANAPTVSDSPEMIQKFEKAIAEIQKEFK